MFEHFSFDWKGLIIDLFELFAECILQTVWGFCVCKQFMDMQKQN